MINQLRQTTLTQWVGIIVMLIVAFGGMPRVM